MSDFGGIPSDYRKIAELDRRVEDLERRAASLSGPAPVQDCCDVYCCNDAPLDSLSTGETGHYCEIDVEEQAGVGLRLTMNCMVVMQANGTGGVDAQVTFEVNGTTFVEQARLARNLTTNDIFTLSNTMVVDTADSAPTANVQVQNLNLTTFSVLAVNFNLRVGPKNGDTACGEVAGS